MSATKADLLFEMLADKSSGEFNAAFDTLYLMGAIDAEQWDFWTASPTRWDVSRNFY